MNEISTSNQIIERFEQFAAGAESRYTAIFHLARKIGSRWEYATGRRNLMLEELTSERLDVTSEWGMVIYSERGLSGRAKDEIKKTVRETVLEASTAREEAMTKQEIMGLIQTPVAEELFGRADRVREDCCGPEVHLRGIIEFSNYCKRNCLYCGLRKDNENIQRYRMEVGEITETAKAAEKLGYKTIVLQSGEDQGYSIERLCDIVRSVKSEVDCAVTLSVGERSYEDYKALKEAGADRYLLKFETSNRELFHRLKPDSSYDERMACLEWLRELGYQVGSGAMVGLPGQTLEILAEDILMMKSMNFDMIGIGPFIPHQDTPLRHAARGSLDQVLRVLATARIVTRNAHMPATTATGSIDPQGRQLALQCGANIMMPNLTPQKYRKYYEIYPNKICLTEDPEDCGSCVSVMIHSLGRTVGTGYGHSLKSCPVSCG